MGDAPLKPLKSSLGIARPVQLASAVVVEPHRAACTRLACDDRVVLQLTDHGAGVRAAVSPADGAELCGLGVFSSGRWCELLYRGMDWGPVRGWPGRAPWLWPVAGWCYVGNSEAPTYRVSSRIFPMAPHGFIRHRRWRAIQSRPGNAVSRVLMHYQNGPDDRAVYPFDFDLWVQVTQADSSVEAKLTCRASPSNRMPMPFSVGNHLTLDLREWWGERWLEGSICGLGREAYMADARRLAGERLKLPERLRLDDDRIANAIVPARDRPRVRLVSPDQTRVLRLRFDTAPAMGPESCLWVTHRDRDRRFFCCEPWVGWPNAINSGCGRVDLAPGEQWILAFSIEVEQR